MLKRTLALILALAILMTAGAIVVFADNDDLEILPGINFKQGDVNIDGNINIKDVTLIQKTLAKIKDISERQLNLADVDGNKGLSIKDATHLQKWIADLVEELYSPEDTKPQETTSFEELPTFGASSTTHSAEVIETTITAVHTEIPASSTAEDKTETKTDATESVSTAPIETVVTDPEEVTSSVAFTESDTATEATTISSAATEPTESEVATTAETVVTDPEEVTSSVAPTESDAVTEATSEATEATETTTKITIITLPFVPAL